MQYNATPRSLFEEHLLEGQRIIIRIIIMNRNENENVARAVYYISPLGSSQNMPPLAQRHPPHPAPSPAPNTNPDIQHQSSHPISIKSIR
jgi:hypothetical protein